MNSIGEIKSAFLLAVTLTVVGASIVLALAEGTFFPVGLTPIFALAALQLNERKSWLILSTVVANFFGVAAVCAAGAELMLGTVEARILSGAHVSVYLTWIVLFMRKQDRQYWWLIALSILQLAVSSVLSQEPYLGLTLVTMMFLIIWTLSLFTLLRLRSRPEVTQTVMDTLTQCSADGTTVVRHGLQTDSGVRWLGPRFRLMILSMCLMSLVLSGVVFAAFPRVFVGKPVFARDLSITRSGIIQRVGFREHVKLGEIGPILQSDEIVLQVSAFDQMTGHKMTMPGVAERLGMEELLFRGNSMGWYSGGTWDRGLRANSYDSEVNHRHLSENTAPVECIRLEITQEPPIGTFAFAPTPVIAARLINAEGRLLQRSHSQSLVFDLVSENSWQGDTASAFNSEVIVFEVYCPPPEKHVQRGPPDEISGELRQWLYPKARPHGWKQSLENNARRREVTQGLEQLVPKTWNLSQQLCTENGQYVSVAECVHRIVYLLKDSGKYKYSLDMLSTDTDLDPVDDFLLNTRTGHCQYFSSAGALMLQSVGIPARIVNGFKGTQDNTDSGLAEVLQKHAHVWVGYRFNGRWHTIDPTPATRRDFLGIDQGRSVLGSLQKAVTNLWKVGINNVTPERQRAAIQPVISAWKRVTTVVREKGISGTIRSFVGGLLSDPSLWISWQGMLGTIACLLPPALLLRIRPWCWMLSLLRWLRDRISPQRRTTTHIVRFYETFQKACARSGLKFPASHTARENARSAERHFRDQLTPDIQEIPGRIADAFNSV